MLWARRPEYDVRVGRELHYARGHHIPYCRHARRHRRRAVSIDGRRLEECTQILSPSRRVGTCLQELLTFFQAYYCCRPRLCLYKSTHAKSNNCAGPKPIPPAAYCRAACLLRLAAAQLSRPRETCTRRHVHSWTRSSPPVPVTLPPARSAPPLQHFYLTLFA